MMEWTWELAHRFANDLAIERNLHIILPDNPIRKAVIAGARFAAAQAGLLVVGSILPDLSRVSICLPLEYNDGSLVLISEAAMSSPVQYTETVSHEGTHDHQSDRNGHTRNAWDYIVSSEVRAQREAEAYATSLAVMYVLTGTIKDVHSVLQALGGPTYHMSQGSLSLASGLVKGAVESIQNGICPPVETAKWAVEWIQKNAPECVRGELVTR